MYTARTRSVVVSYAPSGTDERGAPRPHGFEPSGLEGAAGGLDTLTMPDGTNPALCQSCKIRPGGGAGTEVEYYGNFF